MSWIICATCGVKRGGMDQAYYRDAGDEVGRYSQPACWNCDAPGWEMPADQEAEKVQPLGTRPSSTNAPQ